MPGQGRLGDSAQVPADAHGCPACPHPAQGPAILGSPNVNVNGRPALRVDDKGMHAACCGPNMWTATKGSSTVFINGKAAHRIGDTNQHCGGVGQLVEGSADVIVGDATSGGGGSGGSANDNQSGGDGSGTTPPESNPDATANPPEQPAPSQPPPKVPANWQLQWDDGTPIKGFRSHFQTVSDDDEQKLMPDSGGRHTQGQYPDGELYDVAIHGTTKLQAILHSPDGNPVVGAKVMIERAFGDPIERTTDSNGAFQVDGLIGEELWEAHVTDPQKSIEGVVKDDEGKPVAGAKVTVDRAYGAPIELETDANGAYKADGFVEDEEHHVTVSWEGKKTEAQLLDEENKPIAGATVYVQPDGGSTVAVTTDKDGKFSVEGLGIDPHYRLAIVTSTGVAEGKFVDDKGKPVAGVRARVIHSSGDPIEVSSDGEGAFRAEGLIPGEDYILEVISY